MALKFRKEDVIPQCAVVGCSEYPGKNVYRRRFCDEHAQHFTGLVQERTCQEFVGSLKREGHCPELNFYTDMGFAWAKLKCSVRQCQKPPCSGSELFAGIRESGWLYLCEDHNKVLQQVFKNDVGSRLLWEWTQRRKVQEDTERAKRIKAIKTSAAKHEGQRDYMAKVCSDLKVHGKKMLQSWLDRWEKEGARFDPDDWPRAYQDARFRPTIQKYISRHK